MDTWILLNFSSMSCEDLKLLTDLLICTLYDQSIARKDVLYRNLENMKNPMNIFSKVKVNL